MLSKNRTIKIVVLSVAVAISCSAFAADPSYRETVKQAAEMSKTIDMSETLKKVGEVDIKEFNIDDLRATIESEYRRPEDVEFALEGFRDIYKDPANTRTMSKVQSLSGIANFDDAEKREDILNFLGLSESRNHLYIFVSYSMPVDMIRAYAREALWSGASLVIKGLEPGEELSDFIQKKAIPMVGDKGFTSAMHFDPRLFEAFDIQFVPSVVLADENFIEYCQETDERLIGSNLTPRCGKRPDDRFIKISGAITLDYALEQFIEEGKFEKHALERLEALRQGLGFSGLQEQVEIYEYDDSLLPHQKQKLIEAYSQYGEVTFDEKGLDVKSYLPPEHSSVRLKRNIE